MKNKNNTIKPSKPSHENKFKPVAHGCVRWSKRKLSLIRNNRGRDEILAERIVEVEDCHQSSFYVLCDNLLSFISPLIPEQERGRHRYALVVQAPSLDLFGREVWDDISIAWF